MTDFTLTERDFTIRVHKNPSGHHHHQPPHHHLRLAFVVKTGSRRRHGHGHRWRHKKIHIFEPGVTHMNINDSVTVGHQVAFGWEWLDANGNPPPAGTVLSRSGFDFRSGPMLRPLLVLIRSHHRQTAARRCWWLRLLVVDTVTLTVVFGGVTFTASDLVTIQRGRCSVRAVAAGVQITSVVT